MGGGGGGDRGAAPRRAATEEIAAYAPEVLDAMGRSVVVLSPAGEVLYLNPAAEELYGWPAEDAVGRRARDALVRRDLGGEADAALGVLRREGRWSGEIDLRRPDGSAVPVILTVTALRDGAGEIVALVGISADISERRATDARLRAVLAHCPVALFAVDDAGVIRVAEGEGLRASGVDVAALLDRDVVEVFAEQPELIGAVRRAVAGHAASARSEAGGRTWETELRPVSDADGSPAGAIGVCVDVTERVELERELTRLALHDPLTGLPNRALALDRLRQALNRRRRREVAVLFLDVDELKRVNDVLGHAAGDALLRVHADRLRTMVRSGDTVARYAGDEFLVVAQDLASGDEAVELAERLLAGIAVPVDLAGVELVPSVSIGIAVAPRELAGAAVADDLLRDADAAMYQAKHAGRGRARMFDPSLRADVLTRLRTEEELRTALAHGGLEVHYQTVHDLRSGAVATVEALVRWRHPERGLLVPAQFLEVAEGAGLLTEIGEVVLGDACRQARSWADAGHAARVAVNLSDQQLGEADVERWVGGILDAAGLDPGALVIEVTEAATVLGAEAAVAALGRLRALGVGLSLDGFGTGTSSLTHLRTLPVDELKIDRSLVAGLDGDGRTATGRGRDAATVAAVVDLAHALGLRVVAEGIEQPAQLAALAAMGCDLGQGHLLGRPVAAAVLLDQLAGGSGAPGPPAGRPR